MAHYFSSAPVQTGALSVAPNPRALSFMDSGRQLCSGMSVVFSFTPMTAARPDLL
jgi:hypothetical protein